jgi:nucleolar protein 56
LGAEKALFKHIKFGSKPPKYGILFKLPAVTNAQREKKGRIARAYATKISIALKADHFSKNFIAERLKESLDHSLKKIEEQEIAPRPRQEQQFGRRQSRSGDGRNRWRSDKNIRQGKPGRKRQ